MLFTKRIQKTKLAVFQSFAELLQHIPYSQITIQMILDSSGIGRGTFYSHFPSKESLFSSFCFFIVLGLIEDDSMNPEKLFPESEDRLQRISSILNHAEPRLSDIRSANSNECRDLFKDRIISILQQVLAHFFEPIAADIPSDFLLHYLTGGLFESILWWSDNPEYSSGEMIDFIAGAVPFPERCSSLSSVKPNYPFSDH